MQRGIEVKVEVKVEVKTQRTTHVPMQETTRLKILLEVLPDVLRTVLRETKPRVRREVPVTRYQFPVRNLRQKAIGGARRTLSASLKAGSGTSGMTWNKGSGVLAGNLRSLGDLRLASSSYLRPSALAAAAPVRQCICGYIMFGCGLRGRARRSVVQCRIQGRKSPVS